MKILFDAETAPDVLLFGALAKDLEKEHEILFLVRDFSETVQLIKQRQFEYQVIGVHKGKKLIEKASEYIYRLYRITSYLKKNKPDICVHRFSAACHSSYLLGIPSVSINDNEKAILGSRLALPFTTRAIFPNAIPKDDIKRLFGNLNRTYFYDGIEEMIYLSDFEPNNDVIEKLKLNKSKKLIVMRPEQSIALYYHGTEGLLKPVIRELCFENQIVLMTRSEKQKQEYLKEFGDNIIIPQSAIDGPSLLYYADLFIGAHGTMSREACVLGTPTISMYSGDQLAVEKYLIKNTDRYYHSTDPKNVIKIHRDFMKKKGERIKKPELKREIIEQILSVIE